MTESKNQEKEREILSYDNHKIRPPKRSFKAVFIYVLFLFNYF